MKSWRRLVICIILFVASFVSVLTIKWRNEVQAALCPPSMCCLLNVVDVTSSDGTEITHVFTSCGTLSILEYPNGSIDMLFCNDNGCLAF